MLRSVAGRDVGRRAGGKVKLVLIAVLCAVVVAFPLVFSNPTVSTVGVFTLIFMVGAIAWNMFSGSSGYIMLGNGVFFGSGAYTLALLARQLRMPGGVDVFALLPVAGLVAGVIAIPFGLVAFRVRRHTFVVLTVGVFFLFQQLAYNLAFTGGTTGVVVVAPNWQASIFNLPFYYVALVLVAVMLVISIGARRRRFGLHLIAIRDDEERARSLGVRVGRVKLTGFTISAIAIGMIGALYAYFVGQIFPQYAFNPTFDITLVLMAYLGGVGSPYGAVLGAMLLEPMDRYLTIELSGSQLYLILYGALFLVVLLFLPRGIIPSLSEYWKKQNARRRLLDTPIGNKAVPEGQFAEN